MVPVPIIEKCYFARVRLYMFIANMEHNERGTALFVQRGDQEMEKNNEPQEVIEFCLKHDLIKKTEQGYIIKKEFFEILDYFNE